jgi:VWFA-related protein
MTTLALALFALQAVALPGAEVRTVRVSIASENDRPVEGLVRDEVAVLENGVAREIVKVEADRRPLSVAILVDTSQELGSIYRLYLVDAVQRYVARLPDGARYSLWTTGDRPRKILELTDDKGAALPALRRVVPQGGNTMLDAIAEASKELKKREGERTALVGITGRTTDFSNRDRYRAVEDAEKNAEAFYFLGFDEGEAPFETRAAYDYVMDQLVKKTGGRSEHPLSAMAAPSILPKLAADLAGAYRVSYATLPEIKNRKLEVQVARPGVQVRVGLVAAENN